MESKTEDLTNRVKIEDIEGNGPSSELDEFKAFIMQSIDKIVEDKIRAATQPMWKRLQKVEEKADMNYDSIAETRGIAKNHIHVD